MKAKEYAKRITNAATSQKGFDKAIVLVMSDLLMEVVSIAKARGCQVNSAYTAVLDEIDDKYQAICRIVDEELGSKVMIKTGFRKVVLHFADQTGTPEVRDLWHPKILKE